MDVKQTEDKYGDKTGQGFVKFNDKKSVDKVFDMGRSHHVLECKFQISRRKVSLSLKLLIVLLQLVPLSLGSEAIAHDLSLRSETSLSSASSRRVPIAKTGTLYLLGGLKKDISDLDLSEYFEKFGRVKKVQQYVKGLAKTGKGHIIFESESSVKKVFEASTCHRIKDSRISISANREGHCDNSLTGRNEHDTRNDRDYRTTDPKPAHVSVGRWLFVEGIRSNVEEDDIERYFETFGRVSKIMIKRNKHTGTRTGQADVKFDSSKSVQLLKDLVITHYIKDCKINLKWS